MMSKLGTAMLILAIGLLFAVLASLVPSDFWLLRTVDLVREPLSYFASALLVVSLFAGGKGRWLTIGVLGLVIVINVWRIWPYSFLAETQIALSQANDETPGRQCFKAMSINVKVENQRYKLTADQIRSEDPDLLFLMETDERWIESLEPVLSAYSHVVRHPQPKAFGLVFATKLPVLKSNVVENTYRDTPTLYATLESAGSGPIEFIGLHPKPPLPEWNTELRDENIVNAGLKTPDRLPDALVMGDFNDVPWSRTTTRFRETGEWRDPRIGRGPYPTFPSSLLALGWPLDHIMLKGSLRLQSFDVLPDNGSDHRGMMAIIC
ncbi:MAG: endonuclease/exonuclease/phosphatase family protein [Parvularcula sp.]|jgi:endonuclease/exonuclease/phosphatase (EEP) superfamily protein YafD|nr:endonuclease/exonuclease/phosphatase family protein [Parvularcula sp.]